MSRTWKAQGCNSEVVSGLLSALERRRVLSLTLLRLVSTLRRSELISFSTVGDPKGGDAAKSGPQAEEDCRYLETRHCSGDWGGSAASEHAADPRTADAWPAAGSTPKQVRSRLHNLRWGDCRDPAAVAWRLTCGTSSCRTAFPQSQRLP